MDGAGELGALGEDLEAVGQLGDLVLHVFVVGDDGVVALHAMKRGRAYLEGHGLVVGDDAERGGVGVDGVEDLGEDGGDAEVSGLRGSGVGLRGSSGGLWRWQPCSTCWLNNY